MISDFQASGWTPASATFKLGNNTQLTTLTLAETIHLRTSRSQTSRRVASSSAKYLDNLVVHVSNFSDTPKDQIQVDFQINEQTVEKRGH